MSETIFLGADHAGLKLKRRLGSFLKKLGYHVVDLGAQTKNLSDDYPDYAKKVALSVSMGKGLGILVCGSAEGMCIAANKVKGIRAVVCWTQKNAKLSREHNDANILCLSGWDLSDSRAQGIVNAWLSASFSGLPRHLRRINKIKRMER